MPLAYQWPTSNGELHASLYTFTSPGMQSELRCVLNKS